MISKREIEIEGEKMWFCGMTGVIAGEKKWSESRTQGGTVGHPGGGVGVRISTTVSTRHEFWLVSPDGDERCVEFGNSNVSVREGQLMTAIWGAAAKTDKGPYLMLRNNNAQTDTWLISDAAGLLKRMGLSDPLTKWGLIGGGAALVLFLILHGGAAFVLPLLALLGGLGYGFQARMTKARAVKQAGLEAMNLELKAFEEQRAFAREEQRKLG